MRYQETENKQGQAGATVRNKCDGEVGMIKKWSGVCVKEGGGTGGMVVVTEERRLPDMLSLPSRVSRISRVSVQQSRDYADADSPGEPDAHWVQDPPGFGNCGKPA